MRRITLLLHSHTLHTQRSPVPINHVDADEWKRAETTQSLLCGDARRGTGSCSAFTHLLSRQQIHSADGDELGDVCTATIFPGCVCACVCVTRRCDAYRRRVPGCRWSLMVVSSDCAPSPPLCLTQLQDVCSYIYMF